MSFRFRSIRSRAVSPVFAAVLTTALTTCLVPRSALADPTPTEVAVARRLFEDAVRFEREGRWELAASKLQDAIAVKDTPGLRFHLAHCEDKLGHLVEAMIHYDHARELIAAGAKAPDVEELLEPAREALEQRLPNIVLVAPAEVTEMDVELDHKPVTRSIIGRPAPLDPGNHHVLVRAPGYRDFAREVTLREGERLRVAVDLVPVRASTAGLEVGAGTAAGSAGSDTTSARTYVLVAESALTLAALGIGVGFFAAKEAASDRADRARHSIDEAGGAGNSNVCGGGSANPPAACADLVDAVDSYHTARTISAIGLVGGGLGAAATALTWILWPQAKVTARVDHSGSAAVVGFAGRF